MPSAHLTAFEALSKLGTLYCHYARDNDFNGWDIAYDRTFEGRIWSGVRVMTEDTYVVVLHRFKDGAADLTVRLEGHYTPTLIATIATQFLQSI